MTRTPHFARWPVALAALLGATGGAALLAACDGGRTCYVAADCASGVCGADGRCAPAASDAGATDGGSLDGPAANDAEPADGPAAGDGGGAPVSCSPDDDGVITRAEVPLKAGLHATFRVAQDATVDTAGTPQGSERRWDFSAALTGDHPLLSETLPLASTWFASKFPGATYAARLADSTDLLGVFEVTDAALLMRGVVSPADGLYRTELTYDPPVQVLAFPLQVGATFTTTSLVTGFAMGVWSAYGEKYESQVDAGGQLKTPYGTFRVLRVRTLMTRTVGLLVTTARTFAFVTDCFGTVATVRSGDNESTVEFTTAAELWRLSP